MDTQGEHRENDEENKERHLNLSGASNRTVEMMAVSGNNPMHSKEHAVEESKESDDTDKSYKIEDHKPQKLHVGDDTDQSYKIEDHKPQKLHVGDRVEARWQGRPTGRYLPGKIHAIYLKNNPADKKLDHDEVSDLASSPYLYDIEFDPMPYDPDWTVGDSKQKRGSTLTASDQMHTRPPAKKIERNRICKVTEVIQLSTVLKHKSEFDGLAEAFRFLAYLLVCLLIPAMFIDKGGSACRAGVNDALASYEDYYGVTYFKDDSYNVIDMFSYGAGLMTSFVSKAEDGRYGDNKVMIGDALLQSAHIQFLLEFDSQTRPTSKPISTTNFRSVKEERAAWTAVLNNSNPLIKENMYCEEFGDNSYSSSVSTYNYLFGEASAFIPGVPNMHCWVFIFQQSNNITKAAAILEVLEDDLISQVGPALVFVNNHYFYKCGTVKTDGGYSTFGTARKRQFSTTTTTVQYKARSVYSSHSKDVFRTICEVMLLIWLPYHLLRELEDRRKTIGALGDAKKYSMDLWNLMDILGLSWQCFTVFFWYLYCLPNCEPVFAEKTWTGPWSYHNCGDKLCSVLGNRGRPPMQIAAYQWGIFGWAVNFIITGFRAFQYFRFHPGIAVYVNVFFKTWESMRDFLIWFSTIMLVLTLAMYFLFGYSGGNSRYPTFPETLNNVALLTFGFGDYESIYNGGTGFGGSSFMVQIVFWFLVALSILFAQNIILAIVGQAYDECSEIAEGCDSFVSICLSRFRYAIMRNFSVIRAMLKANFPKDDAKFPRDGAAAEPKDGFQEMMDDFKENKLKPKHSAAHCRESATFKFEEEAAVAKAKAGGIKIPKKSEKEEENENCSWCPKWGNIVCCCCFRPSPVSEEETLATIELELFLQERKIRYLRWYACSAPEMEGAYAYFQHPLRLEPELDFWLWDNGAAIKEADAKLRENKHGALWHDIDWTARSASSKASNFLDRHITKPQLIAILNEISKVPKLNTIQAGWFRKTPMFRVSSGSQKEADEKMPIYVHGSRGTCWEEYEQGNIRWIDNLFDAFKEDIVEAPWDDDDKEEEDKSGDTHIVLPKALPHQQQRKTGTLFFNKRRTLTKTTRSIEDQVRELAKTTETLTKKTETSTKTTRSIEDQIRE